MKIGKIKTWLWHLIDDSHLYKNKGEALFKSIVIGASWGGALLFNNNPDMNTEVCAAFYFFSLSIIMEYAVALVNAKKFVKKILPLFLVLTNCFVFIVSLILICGKTINGITYDTLFEITKYPIIIIIIDMILTLIIEPPEDTYTENNLKNL